MSTRIQARFKSLADAGRKALIPYITAGDPHPSHTVELMHALVAGGADIVELGVPFSDPMADGPTIQLACERALAHGTSLAMVMDMVAEFRQTDALTPVVLMGYLNPVEAMGLEVFATRAAAVGVDGVLLVDLSVEEAAEFVPTLRAHGLDAIFLLAPTSTVERIEKVGVLASGYAYYVSLKGVTGAATLDIAGVAEKLKELRAHLSVPIAVGFGIRDAATAAAIGRVADGVVVGSALVGEIEKRQHQPQDLPKVLGQRMADMRTALDSITLLV